MDIVKHYLEWVAVSIDEKGLFPQAGIALIDGKLEIAAMAVPPVEIFDWFWDNVACKTAKEVIFGLDRTTNPDQGTEFADVLTVCHWVDGMGGKNWAKSFNIGVINYQHEPRIVRPIDWGNEFWIRKMSTELRQTRTYDHRIVVTKSEAVQ